MKCPLSIQTALVDYLSVAE